LKYKIRKNLFHDKKCNRQYLIVFSSL
jgi:hypothetical protein